jgi:hypothetical protein
MGCLFAVIGGLAPRFALIGVDFVQTVTRALPRTLQRLRSDSKAAASRDSRMIGMSRADGGAHHSEATHPHGAGCYGRCT